jgi:hypothetical protein
MTDALFFLCVCVQSDTRAIAEIVNLVNSSKEGLFMGILYMTH